MRSLARPPATRRRRPELDRVASGVAVSGGEVVLEPGADPAADPLLLLRAAAEAAERGLMLAPATAARLARRAAGIPEPWGPDARNLLTRLLAAGPGLLAVWETLDETGALDRLLPEWQRVRLLPHASAVHRYTVDRHLVETCTEASRLIRRVSRPDVLMTAALLHDIGKGGLVDHSVAGEPLAGDVAARLGFDPREVDLIRSLVRWHLLLAEVATTRDLEDPATVAYVEERIPDAETLDLLEVLTEADARATSPKAWSSWRAGLVADLVRRVRLALRGRVGLRHRVVGTARRARHLGVPSQGPAAGRRTPGDAGGRRDGDRGLRRPGGADGRRRRDAGGAAGLGQVGAGVDPGRDRGVDVGRRRHAPGPGRAPPAVRARSSRAGSTRRPGCAPRGRPSLEPTVQVRHEASQEATVLEVRVDDRPGVVYLVCAALARLDLSVRSAHVTTLGSAGRGRVLRPGARSRPVVRRAGGIGGARRPASAAGPGYPGPVLT